MGLNSLGFDDAHNCSVNRLLQTTLRQFPVSEIPVSVRRMVSRPVGDGSEPIMLQLEDPILVVKCGGDTKRIDRLDVRQHALNYPGHRGLRDGYLIRTAKSDLLIWDCFVPYSL